MTGKRMCDIHKSPTELHRAFAEYCEKCERNCPMGCVHRKEVGVSKIGVTTPLALMLDYRCASIMSCFADFAYSRKKPQTKKRSAKNNV